MDDAGVVFALCAIVAYATAPPLDVLVFAACMVNYLTDLKECERSHPCEKEAH
jgi:hypothetical protein